jgi:outer membrane lipase/esterase
VKDQRAPLRTILVILPAVVLAVVLGSWAPAGAQAQFNSMIGALGPNCNDSRNQNLQQCGCAANGLNTAELSSLAPDEVGAQGAMSTSLRTQQLRALGARLAAIRGGASGLTGTVPSIVLDQEPPLVAQTPTTTATDATRVARSEPGRLGLFINGTGAFGDRDDTDLEIGYDFSNYGFTAGADYRFTPNLVAGVALSYYRTNADFNSDLGSTDTNSFGISFYGTYYVNDFFIDLLGGFMWNSYDNERHIQVSTGLATPVDTFAKSDTDGQQYSIGAGVGYDFHYRAFRLTPLARLDYVHLHVDGYTERDGQGFGLDVNSQNADSLQSGLGAQVAYAWSLPFGVLVPQVRGEWRHEFLDDQRSVRARFLDDPNPNPDFLTQTDKPDRDYFVVAAGLSAGFARGISAFLNYETFLGLRDFTRHEFTGGVRVEF